VNDKEALDGRGRAGGAYENGGRLEEVEEGVVEEVEVAGGVDVGEARHLGGEVGLAGAGAEQAA